MATPPPIIPLQEESVRGTPVASASRRQLLGRSVAWPLGLILPAPAALAQAAEPPWYAPPPASASKPFRVAFLYVGPIGDGGWTYMHETARRAAARALGRQVEMVWIEKVPEGPGATRVLDRLASQSIDMVFATTFGYMEPLLEAAARYPHIRFEHASGYKLADNLSVYDLRFYEGFYLAGVLAGGVTRSNALGIVASIPIPEVIRNINALTLGARSVNPAASVQVKWVNSWYDPQAEATAARRLIDQGVDVLFQNTDSEAVLGTAERAGLRAVGLDSDMAHYGPKAHLASIVGRLGGYYTERIRAAMAGRWTARRRWSGVREGAVALASIAPDIPEALQREMASRHAGLQAGELTLFQGLLKSNQGRWITRPPGQDDETFIDGMNFFVEGVQGDIPG